MAENQSVGIPAKFRPSKNTRFLRVSLEEKAKSDHSELNGVKSMTGYTTIV